MIQGVFLAVGNKCIQVCIVELRGCFWDQTVQLWHCATYNKLTSHAQNLCFCVGLKCILKVVFNAVNLAYPKVNVSCLCEALLHIEYACEISSSSS